MAKIYAKLAPYKNSKKLQNIVIYSSNPRGQRQTDFHVHVRDWDDSSNCVLESHPNHKNINSAIKVKVGEWENERLNSSLNGTTFDPLKKKKENASSSTKSFLEFCKEQMEVSILAESTKEKDNIEWRKLQAFDSKTTLSEIDSDWTNRYKYYMEKNHPGSSTLHNSFKFLKKMLKKGKKFLKHDPFEDVVKPSKPDSEEIRYLDPEEVVRLEEFCFSSAGRPFIRCALWQLYACYSGLRYSDWDIKAIPGYLQSGKIETRQTKSRGNAVRGHVIIPLYPKLRMIMEQLVIMGKRPYTLQPHNQVCKAMAPIARINEDLTSHFGRHSFGVFLAEMDVPPQVAMKLLGHRNIRETMIYYEITPRKVAETVAKLLG